MAGRTLFPQIGCARKPTGKLSYDCPCLFKRSFECLHARPSDGISPKAIEKNSSASNQTRRLPPWSGHNAAARNTASLVSRHPSSGPSIVQPLIRTSFVISSRHRMRSEMQCVFPGSPGITLNKNEYGAFPIWVSTVVMQLRHLLNKVDDFFR